MRFGIQPLMFNEVIRFILKEGLDTSKFNFLEICERVLKEGFKHVELSLDAMYVVPTSLDEEIIRKLIELKDTQGISYSVHLPIWSIELTSPNKHIRRASVESIVESINISSPLEPECYVLHLTGALAAEFSRLNLPPAARGMISNYILLRASECMEEIISKSEVSPQLLAIENIEFPFEQIYPVIVQYDLSICFDVGHLLAGYSNSISTIEFLKNYWDRIVEIHLHDGFHRKLNEHRIVKDHLPLGEGDLPIEDFFNYLHARDFKGPLVFELGFEDAKKSLKVIKERCPNIRID